MALAVGLFPATDVSAATGCFDKAERSRDCAVLVVHSYHPSLGWTRTVEDGFRAVFSNADHVRIDSEFLDAKRRPDLGHAEAFIEILDQKYRSRQPDVLVISDDPAFELIWSRRQTLFPNVPVVFMGLNAISKTLLNTPGVTGVFENHRTEETVALSLALTKAPGIVVINDTSETGRANESTLSRLMEEHRNVEWVVERDLAVGDITRLAQYPPDWPIIPMLPLREDGQSGPMLSQARSIALLRASLPQPLFYDTEWLMGSGVVGGYMLQGRSHARQAAQLVQAILEGATPESLPVHFDTAHAWIFDGRELERFGWNRGDLPKDAEIRFVGPGYVERHRELIIPADAILILAALIIVVLAETVRRQRRAELALRAEERRLSAALAASDAGVFEIRQRAGYASDRWLKLIGVSTAAAERPSQWMRNASAPSRHRWNEALRRLADSPGRERLELVIETHRRRLDVLLMTERNSGHVVGVATDITRQRQIETEAASRTRLQALGELAGGVAHDFNNMLTVINGTTELVLDTDDLSEIRAGLSDIEDAGVRAADLVERLLLFGRRDHRAQRPTDLNLPIRDIHQFLLRLVGERHEVVTLLHDEPIGVPLDASDVEQVVSNLVLNARDAMPKGGIIHITTEVEVIDERPWAVLTVRDDGIGMDDATRNRIFEPFFTTKLVGDGSGLGLSTVWGIVSGSGGRINVKSSPGRGTTMTARWPCTCISVDAHPSPPPRVARVGGSILIVEDDPGVALVTKSLLTHAGYRVCLAADGREGLQVFAEQPDAFDLVFADVVLPHLSGIDMVREIRNLRPAVRVGFCTGYIDHPSLPKAVAPKESLVLRKPFSKRELDDFVRNCMA